MSDLEATEYACPSCDRRQPWRPEAAGRPVTCPCGATLVIPFAPGAAQRRLPAIQSQAVHLPLKFDAIPAETTGQVDSRPTESSEILLCPDCGNTMPPGAAACAQCGYHRPKPKKRVFRRRDNQKTVATDRPRPAADHWDELTIRPFRDRTLPIGLALSGLVVQIALLARFFGQTAPASHYWAYALAVAPLITFLAAATIAVVFLIALILTPLLDLSLGPIAPLTVKLSAAVVFPEAVGALLWALCGHETSGLVIGWMASLVLSLCLFRMLFEFDWPDAMLLIAFVSLAHILTSLVILWPLSHVPLPLADMWKLFRPMVAQSALTFLIAGGIVAPHFGQA